MNKIKKILVPVVILAVLLLTAVVIRSNPPEPDRRAPATGAQMVVETLTVERADYPVVLQSYGTVQPRTQSMLVAQVSGQVISVSPNVRSGGFFETGDVLMTIDPRDYEANVRIAEATLMDARQANAEAQARTEQARKDWERLGNSGQAPDLVLRLPQFEAARARVISAQSNLDKVRLDLERTRVVAPYSGRILRKLVDVGQVVSMNTALAEIFASDYVEIRLPLKNRDLQYIELPEAYRGEAVNKKPGANVTIRSDLVGPAVWQAQLVRTEGAIDATARQLHVIAQINDPFVKSTSAGVPLKIGQYVTAKLAGRTIEDAIVIPNGTIYQGSYIYLVEDGLLQRRNIQIAWQNDRESLIDAGLRGGEELVTTSLGQVTSGIPVKVADDNPGRIGAKQEQ